MGLTLGAPWGALALVALPLLVAAYYLRKQQPPRVVSALFLWRQGELEAEAGPRPQRFARERSLLLEILAVLCATAFLADLRCGELDARPHLVIVLDGSLSMAARVDGVSAADRARAEVAELIRVHRPLSMTLVETGPRPTVLAGPQAEVARAQAALERWTPSHGAHDALPALVMAKELTTARVFFFTDGPWPAQGALPTRVLARSVGRPLDNVAFLSASRHDEGGLATLTVRVGSFASTAQTVPVRFEPKGGAAQSSTVRLEPSGTAVVRLALATDRPVTVSLPPDALPEDGHLTLQPSPPREVTVRLLPGLSSPARLALDRFLAAARGVRLGGEPAELTIGPEGSPTRLTVGASGKVVSFLGPFFAEKGHPLLDDVALGGVVWSAGASPPGRPLVAMGEVVLVSEEDDGVLHFNLDLATSNLARTVAWPVLLSNVVSLARRGVPGFARRQLTLAEEVPVVTSPGARWELRGPDGLARALAGHGAASLAPMGAGRWVLLKDGEPVDALEVMAIDARESELRDRGPWEAGADALELTAADAHAGRSTWPLALMLALVLLDAWLIGRGRSAR
jgi:hypothetical protein